MKKVKKKKKRSGNEIWDLTKKLLGIIFIIVGVAGLFLPFLQGILFILIGLALYHNKNLKEVILKIKDKLKKGEKNPLKLAEL